MYTVQAQTQPDVSCYGSFKAGLRAPNLTECMVAASWSMEELSAASQPGSQRMMLGSMGRVPGSSSRQSRWQVMEATGSRMQSCSSLSR